MGVLGCGGVRSLFLGAAVLMQCGSAYYSSALTSSDVLKLLLKCSEHLPRVGGEVKRK